MFAAKALPGLLAYGPPAYSFPDPDAFREGFVVEFKLDHGGSWIGNFANGLAGGRSAIHSDLGARAILVVASGAGYIVDATERRVRELPIEIQHMWFVTELQALVVTNGLWIEAFNADELIWRSRRFSWDGVRHVARSNMAVTGEAFDPLSGDWIPFRVDLTSGEVKGGSYSGPSM